MFLRRMMAVLAAAAALVAAAPAQAQGAPGQSPSDALKVVLCGTSGPLPVKDRAKPCVAVQAAGKLYLVDVGSESTENLLLWRLPLDQARAVFLTHLHSDHIGDLGEFNLQSWLADRPGPLLLVGPTGADKVAQGFNLAYEYDHRFRKAHHEQGAFRFSLPAARIEAQVVPPRGDAIVVLKDGDLTVTAIPVAHEPAGPAYAYRFDYKGRSVVVSGDTRHWPPLAEAARGVDVMIHEAQNSEMTRQMAAGLAAMGNARLAALITDTLTYHATPAEAAQVARAAGARRLVLYHLTQAGLPFFTPEAFTRGMDDGGPLDWRLATDGMTIELPAGSDAVTFGQF